MLQSFNYVEYINILFDINDIKCYFSYTIDIEIFIIII